MSLKKFKPVHLIIFGISLITLVLFIFYWVKPDGKLHIKVLDVGQGDSIFIQTPSGYKILVDGGPDNAVINQLGKILLPWDRKIDFVILTHPQADHMTGLIEVVKRYQIGKLLYSGVVNNTDNYRTWEKTIEEKKISKEIVTQGQTIDFPDQTQINFLWPKEEHPIVKDLNAACISFKITFGQFDAVLTGDADAQVQPYTTGLGHVELLKVPHHGSKTSLNLSFLNELSPEISIISVGQKNRYGHPTQRLLSELESVKSNKIFRTDRNGSVEVVSDGKSWYTKPERGN